MGFISDARSRLAGGKFTKIAVCAVIGVVALKVVLPIIRRRSI